VKLALAAAALIAACVWASSAQADPGVQVCILNTSTHLTDATIANALPAFQAAVDEDFAPEWNQDAQLTIVPGGSPVPAGCWVITIMDALDVWAAGYHGVDKQQVPFAHVEADADWTIILTHELFEMLADPHIDRYAGASSKEYPATVVYMLEVCDPVENDALAYTRQATDGTLIYISDFVTERWYSGKGGGKMDYTGHLKRAHSLYAGGYLWVLKNGVWAEQTA